MRLICPGLQPHDVLWFKPTSPPGQELQFGVWRYGSPEAAAFTAHLTGNPSKNARKTRPSPPPPAPPQQQQQQQQQPALKRSAAAAGLPSSPSQAAKRAAAEAAARELFESSSDKDDA
jgi:hypothetical protein